MKKKTGKHRKLIKPETGALKKQTTKKNTGKCHSKSN